MTLRQIVVELCDVMWAKGWDCRRMAGKSSLCYPTVVNLVNGITRYPRFNTVYKMAKALKMELRVEITDAATKMELRRWRAREAG
jgi:hypothetical protein